jgi:hypothetical protein
METTWNPDDKSASITLSNGNLTATATNTAWKSVRATEYKSSGKWYFETVISVAASTYHIVGVGTGSASTGSYVGSDSYGYGYLGQNGSKFHSGSTTAYGSTFTLNDVIGVALDLDNGKIWWAKNNVWQAGGVPASGTGEAYSGLSGSFYPMYSPYTLNNAGTLRTDLSSFSYTPPDGFFEWDMTFYFTGYVYEVSETTPVSRVVRAYRRDTGELMGSTTSSGNGYYYLETSYSGSHYITALDNDEGTQYNLAVLDRMIPI